MVQFPFNWVPQRVGRLEPVNLKEPPDNQGCFHLIGFPSEWGAIKLKTHGEHVMYSFHLIGFPSEWGVRDKLRRIDQRASVSI